MITEQAGTEVILLIFVRCLVPISIRTLVILTGLLSLSRQMPGQYHDRQ